MINYQEIAVKKFTRAGRTIEEAEKFYTELTKYGVMEIKFQENFTICIIQLDGRWFAGVAKRHPTEKQHRYEKVSYSPYKDTVVTVQTKVKIYVGDKENREAGAIIAFGRAVKDYILTLEEEKK